MSGLTVCVIPALDAAGTVGEVARGLRRAAPGALVIGIDDGSRDGTRGVLDAECDVVVAFASNRGKGAALRAGIAAALERGAARIVTIDADGQHDPARTPELLDALREADLAIGSRGRDGTAMPIGRRITNALASAAVGRIAGVPVADAQSGYRAGRREVFEAVTPQGDRYEFETEFLIGAVRSGFRVTSVPVPTMYGPPSHFRAVRDSARVVRTIWRLRHAGVH